MIRKLGLSILVIALMVVAGVSLDAGHAWAATGHKVDCDKVMAEVHAGKKTKEVAKDMNISTSSVYRCKKKAAADTAKSKASKRAAAAPAASPAGR